MKNVEIIVDGKAYPCRPTYGAMLRFRNETGRELSEVKPGAISDLVTYLWCCVKSACAREGVAFDIALLDFADRLSPEDMERWCDIVGSPDEAAALPVEEKKSL